MAGVRLLLAGAVGFAIGFFAARGTVAPRVERREPETVLADPAPSAKPAHGATAPEEDAAAAAPIASAASDREHVTLARLRARLPRRLDTRPVPRPALTPGAPSRLRVHSAARGSSIGAVARDIARGG